MIRSSTGYAVLALLGGSITAMADPAPIEILVGMENTKVAIKPGAGKEPGQSFRDCPDCPEMVVVPAGSFTMGSPADEPGRKRYEGPQHTVTIAKPFAVAKFELTWGKTMVRDKSSGGYGSGSGPQDEGWGAGDRPLINWSFEDVDALLAELEQKTGKKYRLLTEAEWEYAARAGTATPYSTGASITKQQARFGEELWSPDGRTASAGSFAPNPWGLYDMHGNVWEWVQDCWHESYNGAPQDGSAWTKYESRTSWEKCPRVLRGGSWNSASNFLRSAYRTKAVSREKTSNYGFRVARSLD